MTFAETEPPEPVWRAADKLDELLRLATDIREAQQQPTPPPLYVIPAHRLIAMPVRRQMSAQEQQYLPRLCPGQMFVLNVSTNPPSGYLQLQVQNVDDHTMGLTFILNNGLRGPHLHLRVVRAMTPDQPYPGTQKAAQYDLSTDNPGYGTE